MSEEELRVVGILRYVYNDNVPFLHLSSYRSSTRKQSEFEDLVAA